MSVKKSMRSALLLAFMLFVGSISAQTVKVNVKDSQGEPIIGASVVEKDTKNGGVTDFDGNFIIKLTAKKPIVVSYIGMKTKTVDAKGKSEISIVLEDDNTQLEEVVAIGYGTVRKKDLTGSVSSINSEKLKDVPVANVSEAMTGKLAGVNITTTEGSPDADVKIRVRGGGSLSQDNSPLYIVDGFPVESISDISPSEIETIDVLKDASSTAIYGAQGANGVVIVTTKSGKEGNVQVNFNGSMAWKQITKTIGVLSPYEYAYYQYENSSRSFKPTTVPIGTTKYGLFSDLDLWKNVSGTDYQDEMFGRTGLQRQFGVNVSGGTKELKYNVGYQHIDEESIMRGSGFQKNNVNAKLNAKLNKWLTVDFTARLAQSRIDGLSGGTDTNQSNASNSAIARAVTWRPIEGLSAIEDSDEDESGNGSNQANPVERLDGQYKQQQRFQQQYNGAISWKPWKGWTFRSEVGFKWNFKDTDEVWNSKASQNSKYGGGGQPQAMFTRIVNKNWRNANTVTYDHKKLFSNNDRLNVMIGQEWQSTRETTRTSMSISYPTTFSIDDVLKYTNVGTPLQNQVVMAADVNMLSFFGRINYTYDEKYLATITMREDGSSKFGSGHRWGLFPSVALAWRISEENFMKNINWLDNLKLRLSWGTAGNNRIGSGLFDTTYALSEAKDRNPYFNNTSASMLQLASKTLYNKDLKWETTVTRNIGIDFGIFRGRINGTLDFYWNTTKDLLMKAIIPGSTGYDYQYQNFGKTSNKGIELTLNGVIIDKKNFDLNATFNIAYNKNKIDELNATAFGDGWQTYAFGGQALSDQNVWKIEEGGSLGEVYGYKTAGFYTVYDPTTGQGDLIMQNGKWQLADGSNPNLPQGFAVVPGGIKFVDQNGDGNITTDDKVRLGNTIPKWTGGFGFDAHYKTKIGIFDASVFCNFSLGNKILNATKMQNSYFWGSKADYNIVSDYDLAHRFTWVDPANGMNLVGTAGSVDASVVALYGGDAGVMDRLRAINVNASEYNPLSTTGMVVTDKDFENASFLRIQNITIGYSVAKKWLKPIHLTAARIYFTAYNLACFTKYSGYDPEVDMSSKSNAMCPGTDYAAYPKSRTYTVGINVSF
jgi:TonB-linked SusC/RagA family outer membrane protein